jgi:hypothetical protein
LSTISYRFHSFEKNGIPIYFGWPKTSLKQKYKNNNYLASEYDNMYYKTSKIKSINKGVLSFYKDFNTLKEARKVSDHIPIWFEFSLN